MRMIEGKEDDLETHSRRRLPSVESTLRRGHRRTTGWVNVSERSLKLTVVRTTADSTSLGRAVASV
jgi:hypothetical protein